MSTTEKPWSVLWVRGPETLTQLATSFNNAQEALDVAARLNRTQHTDHDEDGRYWVVRPNVYCKNLNLPALPAPDTDTLNDLCRVYRYPENDKRAPGAPLPWPARPAKPIPLLRCRRRSAPFNTIERIWKAGLGCSDSLYWARLTTQEFCKITEAELNACCSYWPMYLT